MKNKNLILTVLFTVLMNTSFYGQITSKEVDKLVKNAIKKFNVAGAAVGIVKDGKIIHAKGYGVKSIKTKKSGPKWFFPTFLACPPFPSRAFPLPGARFRKKPVFISKI